MRAIRSRREKLRTELDSVNKRIDAIVTAINSTEPPPLRQLERA
jgi:hypothetical protein